MSAGLRLTIDLNRLSGNWKRLAALSGPAECAAVVKADGYGTGISKVVPALSAAGCKTYFVALPDEGVCVRKAAPDAKVYVLNGFFAGCADLYRQYELMPVLGNPAEIRRWLAWRTDEQAALHVDTGMNRLGLTLDEAQRMEDIDLGTIGVRLLMSHLACADTPDHALNTIQLERFHSIIGLFDDVPGSLANSAGIHLGKSYCFDMVRPGIALYGGASHPEARSDPVVTAEARILQVRSVAKGESIGYGGAESAIRNSRIAVLSAGYADGYHRASGSNDLASGAWVSVAGHQAPLIGRISMDLIAADVTEVPEQSLDQAEWAELFGDHVHIDAVAEQAGTIAYEFLTGLSRRAERHYANEEAPS